MSKYLKLLALWLTLTAAPLTAGAADTGTWEVLNVDNRDGSVGIGAAQAAMVWNQGAATPRIFVVCNHGSVMMNIETGRYTEAASDSSGSAQVMFQLDDADGYFVRASVMQYPAGPMLVIKDASTEARKLMGHNLLVVGWSSRFISEPTVATFSLRGIDAVLNQMAPKCGW